MELRFAGIIRSKKYSPSHEVNDFLIISKTASQLKKLGVEVNMYEENSFTDTLIKEKVIFSMVRGIDGLKRLEKLSKQGHLIINHPKSVLNCYRFNLVKHFKKNKIPFPKSVLFHTDNSLNGQLKRFKKQKIWIKRSDVHSMQKEDVVSVEAESSLVSNAIQEFNNRNIKDVILQEHITGDTVKFYAVAGTDFFHWYFTEINHGIQLDVEKLKELTTVIASLLRLQVYGGDAVVLPDGRIVIIDINDWPSFAPILDDSSYFIAQLIYQKGIAFLKREKAIQKQFIYNPD